MYSAPPSNFLMTTTRRSPPQRAVSDLSASTHHTLHSTSLFPGESATIESVRTVHCLEAELVKLRESTKDALQQAWEEVEMLQQQCASHLEITTQLEADFMETKKKEVYWHKRCLETEKQLMQSNPSEYSPQLSKRSVTNIEGIFVGWPSIRGFGRVSMNRQPSIDTIDSGKSSKRSLDDYSARMSSSNSMKSECCDKELVNDLKVKLFSREQAVQSLERTVAQHVKAMHTMQSEMQCMMETQRIKEKNAQTNFLRKEDAIVKQISALHAELEKKINLVSSQKKRIGEYKVYIKEVTRELERALKILEVAKANGFEISPSKAKRRAKLVPS
jgi:cell division protein FtsL